ncbi:MAG: hypothetical protein MJZ23_05050 [Paludibacteraceae bacterium]|nr:hypothetical protein [Paludibacteraceae bacterium]
MNKTLLGAISAISLLTACNQANNNSTTTTADSTSADAFFSADGRFLDVRGQVKSVTIKSTDCDAEGNTESDEWSVQTFTFNKKGMLTGGFGPVTRITRDSQGQIVKEERTVDNEGDVAWVDYAYNEQGLLESVTTHNEEWTGMKTYSYDKELNCISSCEPSTDDELLVEETEEFEILDRDSHGNWTKRFITNIIKNGKDNGHTNWDTTDVTYGIEIREIVYKEKSKLPLGD